MSLRAFSREVAEFREWMSKALSDQANQAYVEKEALHSTDHERPEKLCEGGRSVYSVKVSSTKRSLSSCWFFQLDGSK